MLAALVLHAHLLFAQLQLPGQPPRPEKPADALSPEYFEWIESNTHILYPLIGVAVLVLIAAGILQAWRSQDLHGAQKAELKRDVVQLLRKEIGGMSAEQLSRSLGLPSLRLVRLLEEMQVDGMVESHTNTQRLTTWHVRGVTPLKRGE